MATSYGGDILTNHSVPTYSTSPSPLGAFSKLPPEVRLCIWGYLMPQHRQAVNPSGNRTPVQIQPEDSSDYEAKGPDPFWRQGILQDDLRVRHDKHAHGLVAVLRSNRQLYAEVSSQLYHRDLCFRFGATYHSDWIPLSEHIDLYPSVIVQNLPGASKRDLLFANFSRFKRIVFEVLCSPLEELTVKERNKFVCRYRDVIASVCEMISGIMKYHFVISRLNLSDSFPHRSPNLPEVKIIFGDTRFTNWSSHGLQRAALTFDPASDIESLLQGFESLRRSKRVSVEIPQKLQENENLIRAINTLTKSITSNDEDLASFFKLGCYMNLVQKVEPRLSSAYSLNMLSIIAMEPSVLKDKSDTPKAI